MTASHRTLVAVMVGLAGAPVAAQQPDSVHVLPELGVRASRTDLAPGTAGLAISHLGGDTARRGRTSPSLDELLAFVPGVLARDRSDYSLDTRITMRGAGARANFGVRGVRVVIDGVPATLPDGQTPLTSLDLELADRIEVARGPLAALHGNGSLGVVSLTTPARFDRGLALRAGSELTLGEGSLHRQFAAIGGGGARFGGMFAASYLSDDGLRRHSRAEQFRLRGGLEWKASERTSFTLRGNWAEDPEIEAPGALTLTEFAADPTGAAPNSLARNAGKSIVQQQIAIGLTHRFGSALLDATTWSLWRDLENPLAAPAPAPTSPTEGVWVGIDRAVQGVRSTLRVPIGLRVIGSAGIDLQQMRDDRVNRRHDAGVVSGSAFLDQREEIQELGGFGQVVALLGRGFTSRLGLRHDRVEFMVDDHLAADADGERTMAAWSVGGSMAWQRDDLQLWAGVGSAFETPTTTELANRPDGATGLNSDLDPARTTSVEIGMRAGTAPATLEAVAFASVTRDAITAVSESGGRSFFANVGETTTRGIELTAALRASRMVRVHGTITALRARFGDEANDASGAPISGNHLPGVVPVTARLGATLNSSRVTVDVDHAWASPVWADDANTVEVPGWGRGITNGLIRVSARCQCLHLRLAVRNLFNRAHATGVVVNGGFGRVVEPGNGRRVLLGAEVGLHK
jgi:iron complex outermembrane receptor protein